MSFWAGKTHAAHHVELLLELLIGVVDAELLKAVDLKCLEPYEKKIGKNLVRDIIFH